MSDPADIRSLLVELADKFGIAHAAETVRLFSAWERIVGPQVASRCRPEVLKDGVLKVRASSSAWAAEVKYLSAEIARRVNDEVGKELVREVRASVDRGEDARERARRAALEGSEEADFPGPRSLRSDPLDRPAANPKRTPKKSFRGSGKRGWPKQPNVPS